MWTRFDIFNVWDIISSCEFSNHFWWFQILKHAIFLLCKFFVLLCNFFHMVLCFYFPFCVLGYILIWLQVNHVMKFGHDVPLRWFMLFDLCVWTMIIVNINVVMDDIWIQSFFKNLSWMPSLLLCFWILCITSTTVVFLIFYA